MIKINGKWKHTEEELAIMKNRIVSEKTKNKIRKSLLGKPSLKIGKLYVNRKDIKCKNCNNILTTTEKENRIFCNNKCEYEYRRGKPLSKEIRKKISLANKGNKRPDISLRNKQEKYKMRGDKNPSKRPEVREKLRIKRQKDILKEHSTMQIGKNETKLLNKLEKLFKLKIQRQYSINGYWLDGYIPELNLAIEIDECYHYNEHGVLHKKDIERENNIKKKLNCKFLRIKDYK